MKLDLKAIEELRKRKDVFIGDDNVKMLLAFAKEAKEALEYYGGFWGVHQGSPINAVNKFTQNRLNETGDKARAVLTKWFGKEGEK